MSEMNVDSADSGPIFVDVGGGGQQFPMLYAQLISSQEAASLLESATSAPAESSIAVKEEAALVEPQLQSKTSIEVEDACIKIEKRPFKCPECLKFSCETEEKLVRHIRKNHRGENPFQCSMCEYSTYNKAVFEEHVRVHQGIKPFKCKICDYRSASKKNTKKHEQIHRDDNPNKCMDCDFIGRNPQSFKAHRVKIHGDTLQKGNKKKVASFCKDCNLKFSNAEEQRHHRKNIKKCKLCSHISCTRRLYTEHLKKCHDIVGKDAINEIEKKELVKLFTCSLCTWSSNSKPRILLHLIHHPNQKVDEEVVDVTVLRNCGIMD